MMLINVIPAISSYAVAVPGAPDAPEVVVYSGKARDGKNAFVTELARFQPFAAEARGGISVTATQIDGTSADNIIVGSGPGIPSEVRVYSAKLPSSPGNRASSVLDLQSLWRRSVGDKPCRWLRGLCDGPLQHCHPPSARGPACRLR